MLTKHNDLPVNSHEASSRFSTHPVLALGKLLAERVDIREFTVNDAGGEKVHMAMMSRGFSGEVHIMQEFKMKNRDYLAGAFAISMSLVLVLLPGLAALFQGMETAPKSTEVVLSITMVLAKFGVFVAIVLILGKKLIPAILHYVAHTGSRELFRLAVLAIALGVAYAAAELFGISLALRAFFAGMILSESALGQQAATESLRSAGIQGHFYVSPETGHEWQTWRRSLREFAPLLFQD